jgi:hypothetical protein
MCMHVGEKENACFTAAAGTSVSIDPRLSLIILSGCSSQPHRTWKHHSHVYGVATCE